MDGKPSEVSDNRLLPLESLIGLPNMRWNKPSRDQAHGTTTGHLVICVGEVSGQARLRRDCSSPKGEQAHSNGGTFGEGSGILRFQRTDHADATPARQYSDKLENGKDYLALRDQFTKSDMSPPGQLQSPFRLGLPQNGCSETLP